LPPHFPVSKTCPEMEEETAQASGTGTECQGLMLGPLLQDQGVFSQAEPEARIWLPWRSLLEMPARWRGAKPVHGLV
jgi:hypothetical protein